MADISGLALQGLKSATTPSQLPPPLPHSSSSMPEPPHAVYQDASQGPFMCSNCQYFSAPTQCSNKYIVATRGGTVEGAACCDLFEKGQGDGKALDTGSNQASGSHDGSSQAGGSLQLGL
jgi:hypothetical protein